VWHDALMKWLTSSIYASVKTIGPRQVKVSTRAMSLVFVRLLSRELEDKADFTMDASTDLEAVLKQYCAAESAAGLAEFDDVTTVVRDDGSATLSFKSCPYGSLCNETLAQLLSRGDFNKSSVPCLRMDTYSAAVALLNNTKRQYRLIQFAPGAHCEGELLAPRGAR
jgi:hypothetical protein